MIDLFSLTVERNCLSCLFRYPKKLPDVEGFVKDTSFFNATHRAIYNVLVAIIRGGETPNPVIVTAKLQNLGLKFYENDSPIEEYIDTVALSKPTEDSFVTLFKELASFKIKRDLYSLGGDIQNAISNGYEQSAESLICTVDDLYAKGVNDTLRINNDTIDLFNEFDAYIQGLVDNPPDPNAYMFGPFESINQMLGSLHRPGNITCIGARSGVGKTSFSLFYNLNVALKYKIPILWFDFGEMSPDELRARAAATLTEGVVSLHDVEFGLWAKHAGKREAMKKAFAKIKDVKFYYEDISRLKSIETLNLARRYKYNKIGRENQFLWILDYLKPFDEDDHYTQEWKQMGKFIQDTKSFLKNELNTSLWTALQLNKAGVTNGRNSTQLDDSENAFGMSDRILQQTSHSLLLRTKVHDELEREQRRYGNGIIKWVKTRHLGVEAQRALDMVEVAPNKYQRNHINFTSRNFHFIDNGDLVDQIEQENNVVDVQGNQRDDGFGDLPPL